MGDKHQYVVKGGPLCSFLVLLLCAREWKGTLPVSMMGVNSKTYGGTVRVEPKNAGTSEINDLPANAIRRTVSDTPMSVAHRTAEELKTLSSCHPYHFITRLLQLWTELEILVRNKTKVVIGTSRSLLLSLVSFMKSHVRN